MVKARRKKPDRYTRLWRQIHENFETTPRKSVSAALVSKQSGAEFFVDKKFVPTLLMEAIKQKFEPIVYVQGCFYHYSDAGFWQEVSGHKLGSFAASKLGRFAKAYYIQETVKLLAYDVSEDLHEFEPAKDYINLKNGMLKVKTGKLKPHATHFNSRIQLPYSFEATAKCPRWRKFLREIFSDDMKKARTLKQWFGYCLTTETFIQKFMVLKGTGANGKTVTLSVLSELIGANNICAVPLRKMERDFTLVTIKDKLVNLCGEIKTSRLIDSDTIKLLTGEDPITVDVKYREPITFRPTAKHIFSTNEMPKFRDKTEALRRRAIFLTFDQTFTGEKCDKKLTKKLLQERSGILRWALEGLKEVMTSTEIYESESSLEYKERFAEALNPVLAFINQACELSPNLPRIKRSTLYHEYRLWHIANIGEHPVSKPSFYERVRDDFPQIDEVRVHGEDYFKRVKVIKKSF